MSSNRSYRCYLLDATGHFAAVVIIDCPDDQTAMLKAKEIFATRPGFRGIELWDLNRWVHPIVRARERDQLSGSERDRAVPLSEPR